VKFIRLAEHMIEQNGEGVLGFITNHGYLDNPTFRGMRWHLMQTFDRIHVLDLHGNANKKEISPDGAPDKNVFDIMQGVAIIIAVKHRRKGKAPKPLGEVRHGEMWGTREGKYAQLWDGMTASLVAKALPHKAPQHPFVLRDYDVEADYAKGFSVAALMPANVAGIVTARDGLVIALTPNELTDRITNFADPSASDAEIRGRFFGGKAAGKYPPGDSRGWKLPVARKALQSTDWHNDIQAIAYRPFDNRSILSRPDMVDWGRVEFMQNFAVGPNLGASFTRTIEGGRDFADFLVHDLPITHHTLSIKEVNYLAPLYLYPREGTLDQSIRVNFEPKLYTRIRKAAGLTGTPAAPDGSIVESGAFRRATGDARPDEVQVFDYIYGVLHCPAYRATYAEFLKIDFPRVPFPPSPDVFRAISEQGETLRRLHLMEDAAIGETPFPFEGDGDSMVEKPRFEGGKVWINKDQGFAGVPDIAWTFPIGGYQPAQKWLKDRKGRTLSWDDVRHYQKIIKILAETDRIMREIELPIASA
jgi:predicted helicase